MLWQFLEHGEYSKYIIFMKFIKFNDVICCLLFKVSTHLMDVDKRKMTKVTEDKGGQTHINKLTMTSSPLYPASIMISSQTRYSTSLMHTHACTEKTHNHKLPASNPSSSKEKPSIKQLIHIFTIFDFECGLCTAKTVFRIGTNGRVRQTGNDTGETNVSWQLLLSLDKTIYPLEVMGRVTGKNQ